jgi:hypothetical protein
VLRRRLILLVPLLDLFAFVSTTEVRGEAADVAQLVEGGNFDVKPTGASVVNATMNQNGQPHIFLNVFRGVR